MHKKLIIPIIAGWLFVFSAPMAIQTCATTCLIAKPPVVAVAKAGKCKCRACRGGKRKKCFRKCPKCNADVCVLKCKNAKVTKLCFDVDQKVVCIPRVTFPWQKCCNPCSKTRTVSVLGVKEYECCECKYTWKLCEPELPKKPEAAPQQPGFESNDEPAQEESQQQNPEAPVYEFDKLYDPSGSDVPPPPPTKSPIKN